MKYKIIEPPEIFDDGQIAKAFCIWEGETYYFETFDDAKNFISWIKAKPKYISFGDQDNDYRNQLNERWGFSQKESAQ